MNVKVACPHCGSAAKQTDQFNHTTECTEFFFECDNSSCKQTFGGVLTLDKKGGSQDALHFRRIASGRQVKTDC